jgi:5-methylcytosine-specific restriction endonuclease McrA
MARKRKKMSEETRKKISLIKRNPSEETRKKLSDAAKRRPPMSEETRKKISDAVKRRPPASEETRKKMSESLKGENHPNWGKHPSEATLKKQSESHMGNPGFWTGKNRPDISGENCHLWRGGITRKNNKVRQSLEMKLAKRAALERDNFTCQKTGQLGGKLEVHHINNFAGVIELRFALDNLITLSKESHKEFHKIYGKKNNTQEQMDEFLLDKGSPN